MATARCGAGASRAGDRERPTVSGDRACRATHDVPAWLRATHRPSTRLHARWRRRASGHASAHRARHRRCRADSRAGVSCTGCCRRCRRAAGAARRGGADAIRAHAKDFDAEPSATRSSARCWQCSATPLCAAVRHGVPRRSADRRIWSAAPQSVRPGRPAGCHRKRRADRRLQVRPHRAAAASTTFRRAMSPNSRSIGRCCACSTRITHVRAALVWTARPGADGMPDDAARCRRCQGFRRA